MLKNIENLWEKTFLNFMRKKRYKKCTTNRKKMIEFVKIKIFIYTMLQNKSVFLRLYVAIIKSILLIHYLDSMNINEYFLY